MSQVITLIILGGILVLSTSSTSTVNAENKIEIFSLDPHISATDDILVTGFVNADSSFKPVRLQVYDPNGELLYRPDVYFNGDGQFSWLFHPPFGKFDVTGTYTVIANHEEISETAKLHFTVNEKTTNDPMINNISSHNPSQDTVSKPDTTISEDSDKKILEVNNNPIQTNSNKLILESPMFVGILVLIIASILAGVIVWMRKTYEKSLTR